MSNLIDLDLCLTKCTKCKHVRKRAMIAGEMTRYTMCSNCHKVVHLKKIEEHEIDEENDNEVI